MFNLQELQTIKTLQINCKNFCFRKQRLLDNEIDAKEKFQKTDGLR